jgi:protocatechuate 3,4-dioxygenase, alpha subunit
MSALTPYQTVGPFFHEGLAFPGGETLANDVTKGTRVRLEGIVRDGAGEPIPDAIVEIWQANAAGRYRHPADARDAPLDPSFDGFGRVATDDGGQFAFATVKPGAVPGPDGTVQAPHLVASVFARGLLTRLVTRVYFDDEVANSSDVILSLVPQARRDTLIAKRIGDGHYRFDIVLQGEGETVFFDV